MKGKKDLVCKQDSLCPWFWICFSIHQRVNFVLVTKTCRSIKTQKHQDGFSLKCLNWTWRHWESKLSKSNLCNLLIFTIPFFPSFLPSLHLHTDSANINWTFIVYQALCRQHTGREKEDTSLPSESTKGHKGDSHEKKLFLTYNTSWSEQGVGERNMPGPLLCSRLPAAEICACPRESCLSGSSHPYDITGFQDTGQNHCASLKFFQFIS